MSCPFLPTGLAMRFMTTKWHQPIHPRKGNDMTEEVKAADNAVVPEDFGSSVNKMMGACWTHYSLKAKECRRCAVAIPCAMATESMQRKILSAKKPDCSPFEYMISLLSQSRRMDTKMMDGCLVYVFHNPENDEAELLVVLENHSDGTQKISITANDCRVPLEFDAIDSFDKATEISKRYIS